MTTNQYNQTYYELLLFVIIWKNAQIYEINIKHNIYILQTDSVTMKIENNTR